MYRYRHKCHTYICKKFMIGSFHEFIEVIYNKWQDDRMLRLGPPTSWLLSTPTTRWWTSTTRWATKWPPTASRKSRYLCTHICAMCMHHCTMHMLFTTITQLTYVFGQGGKKAVKKNQAHCVLWVFIFFSFFLFISLFFLFKTS